MIVISSLVERLLSRIMKFHYVTLKSMTMNGFFIDNELSNINNGYISLTMKRMTLIMNAYSLTVSSFMKSAFKLPASLKS